MNPNFMACNLQFYIKKKNLYTFLDHQRTQMGSMLHGDLSLERDFSFWHWSDFQAIYKIFNWIFLLLISRLFILENLWLFSTLKLVGYNLVVVRSSEKRICNLLVTLMFADCSMITLIICTNYTLIIFFPLLKEISHCCNVLMLFSRNQLNTHGVCFTLY